MTMRRPVPSLSKKDKTRNYTYRIDTLVSKAGHGPFVLTRAIRSILVHLLLRGIQCDGSKGCTLLQ